MYLANQQLFQQQYFKQEKINFSDFGLEREIQERKKLRLFLVGIIKCTKVCPKLQEKATKYQLFLNRVEAQNEKIEHFKESD